MEKTTERKKAVKGSREGEKEMRRKVRKIPLICVNFSQIHKFKLSS